MNLNCAARAEIGTKETNDDRVLVNGTILDMSSHSCEIDTPAIVALCDGCGGYLGGNIAAQTVLEMISHEKAQMLADPGYLAEVLNNCQQEIMDKKKAQPQYSEMCTTIAGCVFCDDITVIFHSGDSRVYRYDKWGLAKMTRDHSVVQDLIDMGEITSEEALTHPRRNVISRCLGIDGRPPEIYLSHAPINPGEKYLLCSDGLWESVSDSELQNILGKEISLDQAVNELIERALNNGSDDNISVCICSRQGMEITREQKPFILD